MHRGSGGATPSRRLLSSGGHGWAEHWYAVNKSMRKEGTGPLLDVATGVRGHLDNPRKPGKASWRRWCPTWDLRDRRNGTPYLGTIGTKGQLTALCSLAPIPVTPPQIWCPKNPVLCALHPADFVQVSLGDHETCFCHDVWPWHRPKAMWPGDHWTRVFESVSPKKLALPLNWSSQRQKSDQYILWSHHTFSFIDTRRSLLGPIIFPCVFRFPMSYLPY